MTRKVVKKSTKKTASASGRRDPATKPSDARNAQARLSGDASSNKKPKIHVKHLSLSVSVGGDDRDRLIEDFIKWVEQRLDKQPYGEPGVHVSVTGAHYILDGKVCLPGDYNPKTQNFKKGAVPPSWAGGPTLRELSQRGSQHQMAEDAKNLSSDEYDKKYGIGKYEPKFVDKSRLITPEMQKKMRDDARSKKEAAEFDGVEEVDWDESDIHDDAKMSKVADESASRAVKKLKSTPKKRVVKKSKPASKKTVRVKKK